MTTPLKVLFAGTPEFAERHLDALLASSHQVISVLSQPDRPAGRGKKLKPSAVKARASASGLPVMQPQSLRTQETQEMLRALSPDVMVVVAYGLILPQPVLDIPRFGCLNVHASLLPRWRGAAPIQRAIEAGDAESGVTIMQMDAGLDTGPMLAEYSMPLAPDETGGSLHARLAAVGPTALISVLDNLEQALARARQQGDEGATYAAKITKPESELDWQATVRALDQKIRAFNPTPTCFSSHGGQRIKIWNAAVVSETPVPQHPGTILRADREGLHVACTGGALSLTRLQLPGGKPLAAADLMNGKGHGLVTGSCFDSPQGPR